MLTQSPVIYLYMKELIKIYCKLYIIMQSLRASRKKFSQMLNYNKFFFDSNKQEDATNSLT
jgi:hypothetical protein